MSNLPFKRYFREYFDERATGNLAHYEGTTDELFQAHCYLTRLEIVLAMLHSLHLSQEAHILDAGCGANPLVKILTEKGYLGAGIDHSLDMIKTRAASTDLAVLYQSDIEHLPFKTCSFDLIFCLGVLNYLDDDREAINEMYRVLKPGGRLIISVPQKYQIATLADIPGFFRRHILQFLQRSEGGNAIKDEPKSKLYNIPRLKWHRQLREAGLTVEKTRGMRYGPFHIFNKNIFSPETDIAISRFFEALSFLPGIKQLGEWHIIQLKKSGS